MRKKCVFCVDNVSVRCTGQDIVSFVSKMSVQVLSCFRVNPRRRRSDGQGMDTRDIKDRKAAFMTMTEVVYSMRPSGQTRL